MIVLGVESSCDETGLALYDTYSGLRAHALYSQVAMHEEYVYRPEPRLKCDVLAFGGLRDAEAGRELSPASG